MLMEFPDSLPRFSGSGLYSQRWLLSFFGIFASLVGEDWIVRGETEARREAVRLARKA